MALEGVERETRHERNTVYQSHDSHCSVMDTSSASSTVRRIQLPSVQAESKHLFTSTMSTVGGALMHYRARRLRTQVKEVSEDPEKWMVDRLNQATVQPVCLRYNHSEAESSKETQDPAVVGIDQ